MPVPEAVFQARGVTKVYRSGDVEVQALRGLDIDLYDGELAVLLGPSGSGKSTLLNILGGLDGPSAGSVRFRDHDLANASDRELTRYRRDHVGFVFQFYNLIPSLTARENVALVTEIASHPMSADEALTLVGLGHRLDHFPSQLSGGEQQRVAIARAISKRPDVLLCDEPTGASTARSGCWFSRPSIWSTASSAPPPPSSPIMPPSRPWRTASLPSATAASHPPM
jgi:putative ABC transport system ATP-binding protein